MFLKIVDDIPVTLLTPRAGVSVPEPGEDEPRLNVLPHIILVLISLLQVSESGTP